MSCAHYNYCDGDTLPRNPGDALQKEPGHLFHNGGNGKTTCLKTTIFKINRSLVKKRKTYIMCFLNYIHFTLWEWNSLRTNTFGT